MTFAHKDTFGSWKEIDGSFTIGAGDEAMQYPPNWPELATPDERANAGVTAVVEPTAPPNFTRRVIGTAIVDRNGEPTREWQYEEYTLDEAKQLRWDAAKLYRDQQMSAGADTPFGKADSTEKSLTRANGVATKALAGMITGEFEVIEWTMYDNSTVVLDTPQKAFTMAASIAKRVTDCQDAGTAIREQIDAATLNEQVFAVDITAGYP